MRVLIIFLFFWSPLAFGQVYQWVDENGVRHFSDQPPPDDREAVQRRLGSLSTYSAPAPARAPAPVASESPRSAVGQTPATAATVTPSQGRSSARPSINQVQCQSYLDRLERIQDQLRRGYREPRGNQLRSQRREISTRYRNECT